MKMRFGILIVFLSLLSFAVRSQETKAQDYEQVRLTAIRNFSKTKLFRVDSVFDVSLIDTVHQLILKKDSSSNYKWVIGKTYPEMITVNILGNSDTYQYFLDTTVDLNAQKGIPSRFVEQNGKLFIWRDKHYALTKGTIKLLDKYHLIGRGGTNDRLKFLNGRTDDSKQGADYYFCRNNLTVFKRVITRIACEYYAPPNIKCKQ